MLPGDSFDDGATTCQACLTAPAPKVRAASAPVVRKTAPRAPAPEPGPRAPLLGAVGSGDLEVRERRAVRSAQAQLVELHREEYDQLLAGARRAEGLRQ